MRGWVLTGMCAAGLAGIAGAPARAWGEEDAESAASTGSELRDRTLGLTFTQGENGYHGVAADLALGLDPDWQLLANDDLTQSSPDSKSNEFRAGADLKTSESFAFHALFVLRSDPGDVHSKGFIPGLAWTLSSLWDPGDEGLKTALTFEFETLSYELSTTTTAVRRVRGAVVKNSAAAKLTQRNWTLGLNQELTEKLSLAVSYQKFVYNQDPTLIDDFFSKRAVAFPGIPGVVSGFLANVSTVSLRWDASDTFAASVSGTGSLSATGAGKTSTLGLTLEYTFRKNWRFSLAPTGSKTEGQEKNTGTLALGAEYKW